MGRPREFDVDEALQTAMELFWKKGYEGTSLNDLIEGMGITKPSLYSYFGNKEQLFFKALKRYQDTKMQFFYEAFEEPTGRAVAWRILKGFVDAQTCDDGPCGCLGVNGALACSEASAVIQQHLIESRLKGETELAARFRQAEATGEIIAPGRTPEDIARYIMTVAQGTAVQAASGTSREALYSVIEMSMNMLAPAPSAAHEPAAREKVAS